MYRKGCFDNVSVNSKGTDIQAEIEHLKDVSYRLPLNETSLPSICCHTFHNTYDT